MDPSAYRKLQDAWHSNNEGSDPIQVFLTLNVVSVSVFIASLYPGSFFLSYLQFVGPIIFSLLNGFISSEKIGLWLTFLPFIILFIKSDWSWKCMKLTLQSPVPINMPWITNFRAMIFLVTAICILAVDFTIFPRRYAKTETFGISLMDLGVGLFIICNGLLAKVDDTWKMIKGVLVLMSLGIFRTITTKSIDYYEHISEYGTHWNFFYTLASCRIIHLICAKNIPLRAKYIAPFLLFIHWFSLNIGSQNWALGYGYRDSFFIANREGISSLLGYAALFFAGKALGELLRETSCFQVLFEKLSFLCFTCWVYVLCFLEIGQISRRLCNLEYNIVVFTMAVTFMLQLISVQILVKTLKGYCIVPPLLASINSNGLIFFLLANVFTGLINIVFQTLLLSPFISYIIILTYSFAICYVCHVLRQMNLTMKFS